MHIIAEIGILLRNRFYHCLPRRVDQQYEIGFPGTGGNQAAPGCNLVLQRLIEETVLEQRGDKRPLHR
ncbi:hypothetical protein D3C73_1296310 [compost metagenome]